MVFGLVGKKDLELFKYQMKEEIRALLREDNGESDSKQDNSVEFDSSFMQETDPKKLEAYKKAEQIKRSIMKARNLSESQAGKPRPIPAELVDSVPKEGLTLQFDTLFNKLPTLVKPFAQKWLEGECKASFQEIRTDPAILMTLLPKFQGQFEQFANKMKAATKTSSEGGNKEMFPEYDQTGQPIEYVRPGSRGLQKIDPSQPYVPE